MSMSQPAPETRSLALADAEVRVEARDGKRFLLGHAAVFNSWSQDLGGFIERIQPGAFARALAGGADVRFLVNHNRDLILGRTRSKTLTLAEDAKGLRFELAAADTPIAAHYLEACNRGDLDGMSFRFYALKESWNWDANPPQRDLIEVDIDDVCLATYPAYADATAAMRTLEDHRRSQPRRDPWLDRAWARMRLAEADSKS
jgi:uncharacterized protein